MLYRLGVSLRVNFLSRLTEWLRSGVPLCIFESTIRKVVRASTKLRATAVTAFVPFTRRTAFLFISGGEEVRDTVTLSPSAEGLVSEHKSK